MLCKTFFNNGSANINKTLFPECFDMSVRSPLAPLDIDVIQFIKNYYVDPPFPKGSYKPDFDMANPPWGKLGKWGEALAFVRRYFENYNVSIPPERKHAKRENRSMLPSKVRRKNNYITKTLKKRIVISLSKLF